MLQWLTRLAQPNSAVKDPVDRRRAQLIASILIFLVPTATTAVLVGHWFEGKAVWVTSAHLLATSMFAALIPVAKGVHFRRAVYGLLGIGLMMVAFALVTSPDFAGINATFLVLLIMVASMFLGARTATIIYGLNIVLVCFLGFFVTGLEELFAPPVISFHLIVGAIVVMDGVYRDKLAEEKESALTLREEWQRALLEATFDGTARIEDGQIMAVTGRLSEIFGVTDEGFFLGKPFAGLFPEDELGKLSEVQEPARGHLVELRALRAGGREFPIEAVFQDLANLKGRGIRVALRDITERREMIARMQITDRMVAMGTLAAGVAHEINNPLTFVSGNLQRALNRLDEETELDRSELQQWLKSASEGTKRVERIVGDLNTFARDPEDDGLAPLEIEKVVDTSISIVFSAIKHKTRLVREHEPRVVVLADSTRLSQVLVNLLLNATQALSDDPAKNEIRVSTFEEDGEVLIEVSDNGPGIPAAILPRIFEPFFTTKPVGLGTGLGLSICKNLVEQMGGVMEAETSSQGTLFRLRLHVAEPLDTKPVPPLSSEAVNFESRYRILVVDDEEEIGHLLQDIFYDHEVEVCLDGLAALERLDTHEFDLVLCDLMMPKMTGMELYAACKAKNEALAGRFVFLTGGAFTQHARAFLEEVSLPRVNKPFSQSEIRKKVANVLCD
jgi:two-component system cell cycle sensor histidine kinase/response regulator CckA